MSSKPPVMDYQESFSSVHNWRVERDVAKELVEQIKKFDLQLSLDLLTAGYGDCCMIALFQGLQREDVSLYMSEEVLKKAREYDTNCLRNAVSDFALASHQKVKHLKDNYESYQASIENPNERMTWKELWSPKGMRGNMWGNNYFLGAAALFLQINIKILDTKMQRTANTQTMFNTFYGNFDQEPEAPPLFLGLRNGCHFQALIPVGTNYEQESPPNGIIDIDDEDSKDDQMIKQDHTKDSDQSDVSMDAAEILKEAELLQEDTASDSDVSMEDKPAKDDLDEKLVNQCLKILKMTRSKFTKKNWTKKKKLLNCQLPVLCARNLVRNYSCT